MHNTFFQLFEMINNTLLWSVSINKGIFLKKQVLNQSAFYGIWIKYFLPLTFLVLVGFPKKLAQFSTEMALTTHKIFLC